MRPYLLISNDDGVDAPGINLLIDTLRPYADILVMAPDSARSGYSCSITSSRPITYKILRQEEGLTVCSCSGTPVDCVKVAINTFTDRRFDLVIGGINHGDNSSVNTHYSGTMGVATEGALQGYPAIAFSSYYENWDANLEPLRPYLVDLMFKAIAVGMPAFTCLNVNFPAAQKFKGIKICRMAHTRWRNELAKREHPFGGNYYWLVGERISLEPDAEDTDDWALEHGYVAITPTTLDVTAKDLIQVLKEVL